MVDQHKLCDDVLVEIFLKLPVKAVFKFKRLSKKWNHLLSTPGFRKDYDSRRFLPLLPLWGFFRELHSMLKYGIEGGNVCFIPACLNSMSIRSKEFFHNVHSCLAVSNGLILCKGYSINTYIVCNPITGRYFELPPPPDNHMKEDTVVGFSYEEIRHDKPAFTVVRADISFRPQDYRRKYIRIETYNSDKGVWNESTLWGCDNFCLSESDGRSQVVGNTIYWYGCSSELINTDVFVAYNFKKIGEKRVHLIRFKWIVVGICVMGESREGNLLCAANYGYSGIRICRLKDKLECYSYDSRVPQSEWIEILHLMPEIVQQYQYPTEWPWVIAFHPQDSRYALMRRGSTTYWYDIELKRMMRSIWTLDVLRMQPPAEVLLPFFHPTEYWPLLL